MTTHKTIIGDSKDLSSIPASSIHLVVTSPPYPMVEMWDNLFCQQDPTIRPALTSGDGLTAYDKMHVLLNAVWTECDRVLVDGGFLCINIGDATRTIQGRFQLYPNHAQIISFFQNKGYSVLPDIHWRKPTNAPNKFMGSGMYPAGAYVTYEHEYILILRKGGKRVFTDKERVSRQKSAYFWEERNLWFSDLWEIKGTRQTLPSQNTGRLKSAAYPFEIPYRLINMYSIQGDTVLDPFAGIGTTGIACMAAKRNSICVEINPAIASLMYDTMLSARDSLNQVIENRLSSHVHFIESLPAELQGKCYENQPHEFPVKTRQEINTQIDRIATITIDGDAVICTYH